MFAALQKYQQEQGHAFVRLDDGWQGRLHKWATRQRIAARNHTLPAARRRQLDEIGFSWDGQEANQQRWEKNLAKLATYKKRFGHCDVNCHWPEDRQLGYWVSVQRETRNKGKLRPDRIDRLERLGFKWRLAYYPGKAGGKRKEKAESGNLKFEMQTEIDAKDFRAHNPPTIYG